MAALTSLATLAGAGASLYAQNRAQQQAAPPSAPRWTLPSRGSRRGSSSW
jgi:hypothetical protein